MARRPDPDRESFWRALVAQTRTLGPDRCRVMSAGRRVARVILRLAETLAQTAADAWLVGRDRITVAAIVGAGADRPG